MGRRRLSGKSPPLVPISPWDRTLPLYPHIGYYPLGILSLPLILYIVYDWTRCSLPLRGRGEDECAGA